MIAIFLLIPLLVCEAGPQRNLPVANVEGRGVGRPSPRHAPAQARLMARRAAEVRAVHALGKSTTGRDRFFIRGFRYDYHGVRPDGSVVVSARYWNGSARR